jgi:hypothetical protein
MEKMERPTSILTEKAWSGLYPAAAADDDVDDYGDDNPKE